MSRLTPLEEGDSNMFTMCGAGHDVAICSTCHAHQDGHQPSLVEGLPLHIIFKDSSRDACQAQTCQGDELQP